MLPEAKAALEALDRARAVVEEASTGLRGSIRIGTMTRIGMVDLPGLLGAFYQRYPLVEVQVTTSPTGSSGLADDVRHGRLDLRAGRPERRRADRVRGPRAGDVCPSWCWCRPPHPLADRDGVELRELSGERFVDMLRGFGNRTTVDRAFDSAGIPRRVQVEVPDLTTVPEYVRAGLGVAVVPAIGVGEQPGVARLRLTDVDLTWTLSAITLSGKRPSRAVTALLDLMLDSIRPGAAF